MKFGKYKGYDIYTVFAIDQQMTGRGRRPIEIICREPKKFLGSWHAQVLLYKLQERQRLKEEIEAREQFTESCRVVLENRRERRKAALGLFEPLTGDEIVSEHWAKTCTTLKAIVGHPVKNVLKMCPTKNRVLVRQLENNTLKDPVCQAVGRFIQSEFLCARYHRL